MKKVQSQASYMSEMDADGDYAELEANMHLIDEFYYGVRIFPGQDPLQVRHSRMIVLTKLHNTSVIKWRIVRALSAFLDQVYVGWVTPQYHEYSSEFDMKKIRHVVVCSLDADYQLRARCCFICHIILSLKFDVRS